MGEIREKLKRVAYMQGFANKEEAMSNELDHAGEAIESEFEKLYTMLAQRTKRIEALEEGNVDRRIKLLYGILRGIESHVEALESKCRDIDYLKGQVELNLINMETVNGHIGELADQIEALESKDRDINYLIEILEKRVPEQPQDPVPTDKDGKPEGGLEKWDMLRLKYSGHYGGKGRVLRGSVKIMLSSFPAPSSRK